MNRKIDELIDRNIKLERKIVEALEYIEGSYDPNERRLTHEFDGWNLAELYDILNRDDTNEK